MSDEISFVNVDTRDSLYASLDSDDVKCNIKYSEVMVNDVMPPLYIVSEALQSHVSVDLSGRHGVEFKYDGIEGDYPVYRNSELGLIVQVREVLDDET